MRRQRSTAATDSPGLRAITLVVAFLGANGRAHAQNAEAEALFTEADKAMADGKIDEACSAFDASNRLEPRAGTMIRLGECREKQNRLASAWSAYRDALTRVKDPVKRQIAQDRADALVAVLSKVTIVVSDANRVAGLEVLRNDVAVDPALWNRALPSDGGSLKITARAPGHKEWSTRIEVPIDRGSSRAEVPKLESITVTAPTVVPDAKEDEEDDELSDEPAPGMLTNRRKIAIALGGVALGAGVTGLVLWRSSVSLEDDAYSLCPDPQVPCADAAQATDLSARAVTRATFATVMFGAAVGAAAGAAVFWVIGAPPASPGVVGIAPRFGHGFAGAALEGRF